nr:unnamed protein product [Digitaria exilis]
MTTITFPVRRQDPSSSAQRRRRHGRLSASPTSTARARTRIACTHGLPSSTAAGADPAAVIRRALGEALVPYNPGRIREVDGKLVVECTGEGVLFVVADADVRLAELEAATAPTPPVAGDDMVSRAFTLTDADVAAIK